MTCNLKILIIIFLPLSLVASNDLGTIELDLKLQPEELVRTYLQKDAEGEFLETNDWWSKSVVCPICMGGPDEFSIIENYRIQLKGNMKFSVTYTMIGKMSSNHKINFKNEKIERIFVVENTKWGFKIKDPAYQMVSKKTVLLKFRSKLDLSTLKKLK